jgi:hypothetical protein
LYPWCNDEIPEKVRGGVRDEPGVISAGYFDEVVVVIMAVQMDILLSTMDFALSIPNDWGRMTAPDGFAKPLWIDYRRRQTAGPAGDVPQSLKMNAQINPLSFRGRSGARLLSGPVQPHNLFPV